MLSPQKIKKKKKKKRRKKPKIVCVRAPLHRRWYTQWRPVKPNEWIITMNKEHYSFFIRRKRIGRSARYAVIFDMRTRKTKPTCCLWYRAGRAVIYTYIDIDRHISIGLVSLLLDSPAKHTHSVFGLKARGYRTCELVELK